MATQKNLILFSILLAAGSCSPKTTTTPTPAGTVIVTVIDYRELDGCEFLLVMDNQQKLQPDNLPEEFKKDGTQLRVLFKYTDGMSVCMAGKMVSLTHVEKAVAGK